METKAASIRSLIVPVAFVLLCVSLTIYLWISFGGETPLKAKGYEVEIAMPSASNLYEAADVRIAGVNIGTVEEVRRTGNTAVVKLELDDEFAPLHAGARAILRTKTLLGEGYVEIAPGPESAPAVRDGEKLPAGAALPTARLDQVLSTLDPPTRARLRQFVGGTAEAFRGRGQNLNNALAYAAPAAADMGAVLRILDSQNRDVRGVISASGDVLEAIAGPEGQLQAAVRAGSAVVETTARRNRELAATIASLPPFLTQLRRTSQNLTGFSLDLTGAVRALEPVVPKVVPAFDAIDSAAPQFRGLFRELPATIASGERGLPALRRTLEAAPGGFRAIHELSRQLLPIVQLTDSARDAVVGSLVNLGSVGAGTFVGPGGRVNRTAAGVPTLWNETITGWIKKLPSNRSNPYPKPNSSPDIGKGGLKAFDCRNTGNRNYLPPLGATPPCKLQGPWDFEGRTAYFPRLTKAAP